MHRLADHQVGAVAQGERRQGLSLVILRCARSASASLADQVGVELAAVGQLDGDVAGAVDGRGGW
jgi:hypothetical protein